MPDKQKIIAVIPAKAESRRLPGKNIRHFAGKPLVAHTIEHALFSDQVDDVYISTDSESIANIATQLGAKVPFLRPAELSQPQVHSSYPVIDLLNRIDAGKHYDFVMVLLPTCPLRRVHDVDAIAKKAKSENTNVLSVVDTGKSLFHLRTLDDQERLIPVANDTALNFQHGDSPQVYALNASCYCGPIQDFLKQGTFQSGAPIGYVMDSVTGMDIDTLEQFEQAESLFLMRERQRSV